MKFAGGQWFIVGLTIATAAGCRGTIEEDTTIPPGRGSSGGRGGDSGRIGQGGGAGSGGGAGPGGSSASCVNLDPIMWAIAITVIIGFTPDDAGNRLASAT